MSFESVYQKWWDESDPDMPGSVTDCFKWFYEQGVAEGTMKCRVDGDVSVEACNECGVCDELSAAPDRYQFEYCHGDEGRAYYVKGHVPLGAFMTSLRKEVDADDTILREQPEHCWMRVCRNFQDGHSIMDEARPWSRGAFKVTWIQDNS